MKFSGIQKTSLIDFPDRIASVLFTPGCNLHCPYCHNWRIAVDPKPPFMNDETALNILEQRKQFTDAVVISGGEPTIHKELPEFLKKLKDKQFVTKLDTNGLNPQVLEECLPHLDYVAVDIKTSMPKYRRLGETDPSRLLHTIEMLKTGNINYEFRTTVVPNFMDEEDITSISEMIKGAKTFALQRFVPDDTLDGVFKSMKSTATDSIDELVERFRPYVDNIILRA
jgi:pyruvate formate lyase activating enzyme